MSLSSKAVCFAGGLLFGTIGTKILATKEVRKVFVHTTAAGLRVKDCVMKTVTTVQEGTADILAEAKDLNAMRDTDDVENEEITDVPTDECEKVGCNA